LLYIGDGFHGRARLPDGAPIFDGYLVGEPSMYPRINSSAPALETDDPRQKVQPRDVPAISLHTRPQEQFRRRADGNEQGDRYRVYEVAGAAHVDFRVFGDFACGYEVSRFPMHHLFKSTLARLDAWADREVTPPASRHIALNADGSAMLDEHGNPLGGVRTTYTDAPTARYFDNPDCSLVGAQERFSTEKLRALYQNHGGYVNKVVVRSQALERHGWLLPADARAVRREAAAFGDI
jgi:Alpha/beta hydrolase domain